ncbi:hypothetical protein [Conchiformibius steedae]|uniref:hypothetical protein n=1 Tax=Conchiformibius steedae TaxID=153493 RepID=UPI0026EF21EA|nr:hypothetical protein [Conchiformibius steedae]
MTIDQLLDGWVLWKRRANWSGSQSKHPLARLMDGMVGGAPVYCAILPRQYDDDAVFSRIDIAICKLKPKYKQAIIQEYCTVASQQHKADGLRISLSTYRVHLCRAKKTLLKSDIFVKMLPH